MQIKNDKMSITVTAGETIPDKISAFAVPLNGNIIFPYSLAPLVIEGKDMIREVHRISEDNRLIVLFPAMPDAGTPESDGFGQQIKSFVCNGKKVSSIGVLGRIVKYLNFPDETVRILVRGLCRVRARVFNTRTLIADVEKLPESAPTQETSAMAQNAVKQFQEITETLSNFPEEIRVSILNLDDVSRITDMITDSLNFAYAEKLTILASEKLEDRLQLLTVLLNRELEVLKLGNQIQNEVHANLSKQQREFFLREQLRTIKEELGEETRNPDIVSIHARLKKLDAPDSVKEVVQKEVERLETIPQAAPEYNISYTYMDWILSLPWNYRTKDCIDVKKASEILDRDHYGLRDVKDRILEFLAILQLRTGKKAPILCFAGPPGVGKTSLGKSIADAMGRKFIRISLGGVRDEAEIRGHRRTYVGALPGRIIKAIRKAGSSNPVFMLDEIDKLGSDFRGDPASALLEVLDPQQNSTFNDHYLEMDYDLSSVMFIATANMLETIPAPLLDRMDIITLPGYTPFEKSNIAAQYLVPRQLEENGLTDKKISFPAEAVEEVMTYYTREAGVRSLERTIGAVLRKLARKVVDGKFDPKKESVVTAEKVRELLGPRKFLSDERPEKPEIGEAVGMAWTSVGGTILCIEALKLPSGKGELKLTGSLGNVMKESALAAFSFIRSRAKDFGILPSVFLKNDFHIHVPDGATPKDGPSAGVTLSTAIFSLLTGRPVRNDISMTGEITLRGRITAVGGIKEKVIGAYRAGIREIILPEENRKDTIDLPPEIAKEVRFHFVSEAEQAWKIAVPVKKKITGRKKCTRK